MRPEGWLLALFITPMQRAAINTVLGIGAVLAAAVLRPRR